MGAVEGYAFLDPWSQLLPDRGVIGVGGSGGCTTVTLAIVDALRQRGRRVLVSQTTPHPVPFGLLDHAADGRSARAMLDRTGLAFVAGPERDDGDRRDGLSPPELERIRVDSAADVVVVQSQDSAGALLRTCEVDPVWPEHLGLAVLVAQVGVAGRLWASVTAEEDPAGEEPRRVGVGDLVASLAPLLSGLPDGVRPLPFFTGLGAWRDLDGMFAIVQELWEDPRARVVILAELLGDERRDSADLRDLPGHVDNPFDGSRIYAVYPSLLDES